MRLNVTGFTSVPLRAIPRCACQPKSHRHIHLPQFGMRCPTAAPEFRWSRHRNKRHADACPPGASETPDVFRLRLEPARLVPPHEQRTAAAGFHFRMAVKARASEENRHRYSRTAARDPVAVNVTELALTTTPAQYDKTLRQIPENSSRVTTRLLPFRGRRIFRDYDSIVPAR